MLLLTLLINLRQHCWIKVWISLKNHTGKKTTSVIASTLKYTNKITFVLLLSISLHFLSSRNKAKCVKFPQLHALSWSLWCHRFPLQPIRSRTAWIPPIATQPHLTSWTPAHGSIPSADWGRNPCTCFVSERRHARDGERQRRLWWSPPRREVMHIIV